MGKTKGGRESIREETCDRLEFVCRFVVKSPAVAASFFVPGVVSWWRGVYCETLLCEAALVVTTLAVLVGSNNAYAVLILPTPPPGPYRLAFVTSTTTNATSSDIATYNAFVTAAASTEPALLALPTTWSAIGSTAAVSAISNTMTDPSPVGATGVPIYTVTGVKIADHYDDLWDDSLDASLSVTQSGSSYSGFVWTGSLSSGVAKTPLGDDYSPTLGDALATDFLWQDSSSTNAITINPLYAISGELMGSAVPEPSAFLCVGLIGGLLGLGSQVWKKLRK